MSSLFPEPPVTFPGLVERLRRATPPHDNALTAVIAAAHKRADDAEVGRTGLVLLGGAIAFTIAFVFPPTMTVIGWSGAAGAAGIVIRHLHRRVGIQRFCREATLIEARAVAPARHCPQCAVTHDHFEHTALLGRKELLLDLSEVGRARTKYFDADFQRIPTLVAAGSRIVLAFTRASEPILGHRTFAELPRATLELRDGADST